MFSVFKGTKKKPVLDSTWPDRSKANDRCQVLRQSLRGKKTEVWVDEADKNAPKYRKPIKGPFTNYNAPHPKRVNGRRA